MAISSALNPASIARERGTTAAAAQNFITGGSPLGSGVVASAANKIVGFQRGAAGVAARPPDLQGIIQTLSTNILNNVESRVQSINQNVTQTVNKIIGDLQSNYKSKLDQIESAKPNSILSNFLNLYKEAIGYIQFLGNRRNVKTLGDNLKALQSVFAETFNIAKIIRQTIVRIVKQLSNLPQATGGGGGLNLDVNVPGGPLRRSLPGGKTGRMLKMAALGTAAVGAGALGSSVVSGMLDPTEGNVQPAPMAEGMIPGSLLDRFNSILDKFSAAINSLGTKRSAPKKSGSGSPAAKSEQKPPGAPPGPGGPTPELTGTGKEGVIEYAQKAGFSEQFTAGLLTNVSHESGGNPFAYNPNDYGQPSYGLFQFRAGRGDNMIKYLEANGIPDAKKIFTDPKDPRRNDPEIQKKAMALQIKYFTEDEKDSATPGITAVQKSTDLKAVQDAFFAGERFDGYNNPNSPRYRARAADIQKTYQELKQSGALKPGVAGRMSMVAPSGGQQQTAQQVAQTVAQPPPQQQTQVTVAPMNMASPQTQSRKVGEQTPPAPIMNKGGVTVPFISSSNNDNFLTLYSKMVYNIIDG